MVRHRETIHRLRDEFHRRGLPPEADDDAAFEWLQKNLSGLVRVLDFIEAVHRESERGCVLCAVAFIDNALETASRRFLTELSGASTALLDSLLTRRPQPPIGSFAVRVKLARALGLIDDGIVTALDRMRIIRNDAAHLGHEFTFEDAKYDLTDLFGQLSEKERTFVQALLLVREMQPERCPPVRRSFEIASMSLYYRINEIAEYPALHATIFKVGGKLNRTGPFDRYLDDLMRDPPSDVQSQS